MKEVIFSQIFCLGKLTVARSNFTSHCTIPNMTILVVLNFYKIETFTLSMEFYLSRFKKTVCVDATIGLSADLCVTAHIYI